MSSATGDKRKKDLGKMQDVGPKEIKKERPDPPQSAVFPLLLFHLKRSFLKSLKIKVYLHLSLSLRHIPNLAVGVLDAVLARTWGGKGGAEGAT